jgi:ABC-type Fe3+/spermidine/putrescine transport system ATPase subunit
VSSAGSDEAYDVEFRAVTKRFGSLTAVNAVSLKVRTGEFLSLLGPSGCGKTTSLRMIAGFEQPDEGEIVIGGRDAVGVPPYRRDVNTVFQQYALFPHMSVLDNVAYGLKQRGAGRSERYAKARSALELVRMTGRERHRPSMLSGGQQQRVALARALVMSPRVLLLDEPLAGMGAEETRRMLALLAELKATHAILLVEHDMDAVFRVADRITVMVNGRVIASDVPERIRNDRAVQVAYLGDAR